MTGDGCTDLCGFCGRCTVDDGYGSEDDPLESCTHPAHWRDEGGCRLCGARNETIAKQVRQRQIVPRLPRTGAA